MKIPTRMISRLFLSIFIVLISIFHSLRAEESVCAQVQMEIQQQASLERQAFDAVMRIDNGLESIALSQVSIQVNFTDELGNSILASSDPDSTEAQFFMRVDSKENISDVNGNGEILPKTTAEIHWLIIPAAGSGGSIPSGQAYQVGATLDYHLGDEEHSVEVIPDTIYVKPLPKITLDYFLTQNVLSDDPFTNEVEPPQTFTLGVRVKNNADAMARNFKIDSAQPKITDNKEGLLINFYILSSTIDGQDSVPDLLLDFGDIPGQSAKVGRWQMQTTLSGQFTEFSASYSHADELGGQLTSILEGVNTYFLVHDVEVSLPGRDSIDDFLALNGNILTLFESDSDDTIVNDLSSQAVLTFNRQEDNLSYYDLQFPASSEFIYLKLTDPSSGAGSIQQITRSDGEAIPPLNRWMSEEGISGEEKFYYLHLFDYQVTGSYEVIINSQTVSSGNRSPSIDFISQQEVYADESLQIPIVATDPDQTIPQLTLVSAPESGIFTAQGDGTGIFQWTPAFSEIGLHQLVIQASDGNVSSQRTIQISVLVPEKVDTDADNLDDSWEMAQFATLDRDGNGDYDNDGISDLEEYLQKSDPKEYFVTGLPKIEFPAMGQTIDHLEPILIINNSIGNLIDRSAIQYQFELYADEHFQELVETSEWISEAVGQTQWQGAISLNDNHWYSWRVRSFNGVNFSQWVQGYFFVNTINDEPTIPLIFAPRNESQPSTLSPQFSISQSDDKDQDELQYQFLFYQDTAGVMPLLSSEILYADNHTAAIQWQLDQDLIVQSDFYWRAVVTDEKGGSQQTPIQYLSFDLLNQAPGVPIISEPQAAQQLTEKSLMVSLLPALDEDGDVLGYELELDSRIQFNSPDKQTYFINDDVPILNWQLNNLTDNSQYYLRARSFDGVTTSAWVQTQFSINLMNEAPTTPVVLNPGQNAWLTTLTPVLQIAAGTDPENDEISYQFEIYADESLTQLTHSVQTGLLNVTLPSSLTLDHDYYWRVRAEDNLGEQSDWSEVHHFIIHDDNADEPEIRLLGLAEDVEARRYFTIRWDDQDPDYNATIDLFYSSTPYFEDAQAIVTGLVENNDGQADSYEWNVQSLETGKYYLLAAINNPNMTVVDVSAAQLIKPSPLLLKTDLESPQLQGNNILLTATYDNQASYQYRFMLKGEATFNEWEVMNDWSEQAAYQWASDNYPGNNTLRVDARIVGEEEILATYTIAYAISSQWGVLNLTRNTDSHVFEGQIVDLKALYLNDVGSYEFQYLISGDSIGESQQVLQAWSSLSELSWNTTDYVGAHNLIVWVREVGANTGTDPSLILETKSLSFQVQSPELLLNSDSLKFVPYGKQVNLSAAIVSGAEQYEYQFTTKGTTTRGQTVVLQDWSTNPNFIWDSSFYIGGHFVFVAIRTPGTTQELNKTGRTFVTRRPNVELLRDSEEIIQHGQVINLETLVSPQLTNFEYRFKIKGYGTNEEYMILQNWSETTGLSWNSAAYMGSHLITAELRPIGAEDAITSANLSFDVQTPEVSLSRDTEEHVEHGQAVNLSAVPGAGQGNYEYRYLLSGQSISGEPLEVRSWSENANYQWDSSAYLDAHSIKVQLRERGKTVVLSESKLDFIVQRATLDLLRDSDEVIPQGQIVTLNTQLLTGQAAYEYQFRLIGNVTSDNYQVLQDWSTNLQYVWNSQGYPDWNRIEVNLRQVGSEEVLRTKTISFSVTP